MTTAPPFVVPETADIPVGLPDDEPLTVGWVTAALSTLCALGLPRFSDWLQTDTTAWERPPVGEMIRDVLDLTADDLGYRFHDGEALPRDDARRDATRTELLLLWATHPRYDDPDGE